MTRGNTEIEDFGKSRMEFDWVMKLQPPIHQFTFLRVDVTVEPASPGGFPPGAPHSIP